MQWVTMALFSRPLADSPAVVHWDVYKIGSFQFPINPSIVAGIYAPAGVLRYSAEPDRSITAA